MVEKGFVVYPDLDQQKVAVSDSQRAGIKSKI
jgi:hypothetical protein